MTKGRIFFIALLTAVIGFVAGYFFYANTVARYDAMSSVCVAMQEAVKNNMLTTEQERSLGMATGSTLKRDYIGVIDKLSIPKNSAANASEQSVCSQFLVGIHESP